VHWSTIIIKHGKPKQVEKWLDATTELLKQVDLDGDWEEYEKKLMGLVKKTKLKKKYVRKCCGLLKESAGKKPKASMKKKEPRQGNSGYNMGTASYGQGAYQVGNGMGLVQSHGMCMPMGMMNGGVGQGVGGNAPVNVGNGQGPVNRPMIICYHCQKPGHIAKDCVDKKNGAPKANVSVNQQCSLPCNATRVPTRCSDVTSGMHGFAALLPSVAPAHQCANSTQHGFVAVKLWCPYVRRDSQGGSCKFAQHQSQNQESQKHQVSEVNLDAGIVQVSNHTVGKLETFHHLRHQHTPRRLWN
jgi:hypothetical protein